MSEIRKVWEWSPAKCPVLPCFGPRATFRQAAAVMGVSRERVRQLEVRFLEHFLADPASAALADRIGTLRASREAPLLVKELAERDPWFHGLTEDRDLLAVLLSAVSRHELHVVDGPEGKVICSVSVESWGQLMRVARAAVRALPDGIPREAVREAIRSALASLHAAELFGTVLPTLEEQTRYSDGGGLLTLGGTNPTILEAILRDSDRPLHLTEISERWEARSGAKLFPRTVLRAIRRSSSVRQLGPGTYGLDQHIRIPEKAMGAILAECERIMTKARPPRQWRTSELLIALREIRPNLPDALDQYVLDVCLSRSAILRPLGRLVWILSSSDDERAGELPQRIPIATAAVEVLRDAGRPLPMALLRAGIDLRRAMAPSDLRLKPTAELARVEPGIWGLVARDFGLDEPQRRAVAEEVYAVLQRRGSALDSSEVAAALSDRLALPDGVTAYMVLQLAAALDRRCRLYYGDLLGLAEWGHARPLTVATAMERVAATIHGGVTTHWLRAEVERLTQRPVSRGEISRVAAPAGLVYDLISSLWRRAAEGEVPARIAPQTGQDAEQVERE